MIDKKNVVIRRFVDNAECDRAARLMLRTDPWKTFGRTYENCLDAIINPQKESYGAFLNDAFLGLLVFDLTGPLKGYLQAVCLEERARGSGLGSVLIHFAEEKIFTVSPNVFLCYSDFNASVKPIYEHLGYEVVGVLPNYMISGHDEVLMRKTIGSVMGFTPKTG